MAYGDGKVQWSDLDDFLFGSWIHGPNYKYAGIKQGILKSGENAGESSTVDDFSASDITGLLPTDKFGDTIRVLQEQAAKRQEDFQTNSAAKAMQFSADEAKKARDWSEYMSATQFSRAVKDLKNAGLNPVLAAGGGFSPGSYSSSTSATGIAQAGSQAQVSDYNSGLAALEVYLETAASVINSISNVFNVDVNKLVSGLSNGKANKIGFGE